MSRSQRSWMLGFLLSTGAAALLTLGLLALSSSCGDGDEGGPSECISDGDCTAKVCYDRQCKSGLCVYSASKAGTACSGGYCLESVCRSDLCFITGEDPVAMAKGAVSAKDSCKICDPSTSQSAWTDVACAKTSSNPCEKAPTCVSATTCLGASCCKSDPIWDGSTGTPPSCTLESGATGVCTSKGKCAACNTAKDCETSNTCLTWTCNADKTCTSTTVSNTSCAYTSGDTTSGVCVSGACLKKCTAQTDCSTSEYCSSSGTCVPKLGNGLPCTGAHVCTSGYCQPTLTTDTELNRCAVAKCGACQGVDSLGSCVSQADGTTTATCTGACSQSYYTYGDYRCCQGTCTCTAAGSCS